MPIILDHSIVGQSATTLIIRKDREFAACRICGDIFQPWINTNSVSDEEYATHPEIALAASIEIQQWRNKHNSKHTAKQHLDLAHSGLTLTPEAAFKLAPFGLVPLADVEGRYGAEIVQALAEAPRAPSDDVETTLRGWR